MSSTDSSKLPEPSTDSSGLPEPSPISSGAPQRPEVRWPYLSLIPLGLGAWAPIYAGIRVRKWQWTVFGIIWTLVTIAGWILVAVEHKGHNDPAGVLLILGWVGAIATSFMIKPAYRQLAESTFQDSVQIAERRLSERQRARKIAREQPALARELGVGRPDVAGAQDAGLVDINNAPASALAKLPGVDEQLATEIVEARAKVNGFESVEDLGAALDLDGNLVESLRDHTVFLPR